MEKKVNKFEGEEQQSGFEPSDDFRNDKAPRRFQRRRQNQTVPDYVDWKDVDYLKRFIPERGKIMPRRISGISAKDQRRIARAIKRARSMALIPFVSD
jgi:small subunit ribosomal protein S18